MLTIKIGIKRKYIEEQIQEEVRPRLSIDLNELFELHREELN